jgi:TRAP-type C4-dicarboxylate transport system substrate-binding protein
MPARTRTLVYANSSLFKDGEEMEALQLGSVQMLAPSVAKFGPLGVREFEVYDLPYIFDSAEDLHKVNDGGRQAAFQKARIEGHRRTSLSNIASLLLLTMACIAPVDAQQPIVIKFSHVVAVNTPKGKGAEYFKKLAEGRTKGRVKVERPSALPM